MPLDLMDELRGVHALEGLPDELLAPLAGVSRAVEIPAGTVIFRQGDAASMLYLLVSGQVALEICTPGGGCKRILTVAAGELLGWSPALGQQQMTATARALTDVRAIELDGARLLAECEHHPRFGYEFMKRAALALAKRLSATRLQLLNLYGSEMAAVTDERGAAAATSTRP
jgi:CRP-like cAMP-binding protein